MSFGANQHRTCLSLQISVQTFGELLIFARITDKAGIELEGAPHQRFHVGDHVLGNASAAEEDLGNVAVREIESIDRRWVKGLDALLVSSP